MRSVSWLGGLSLAVVLGVAFGAVMLQHTQGAAPALAAAHTTTAPFTTNAHDFPPKGAHQSPTPGGGGHSFAAPPVSHPSIPSAPQAQSLVIGSTQQALINADRARNGLGPLTWNGCLYNVAVANARRIAAQGFLSHTNGPNVDLTCGLGRQAGENIGWYSGGANDSWMNSAFMASPEHYANIMGPYHYVATAWVVTADGKGWIAVEFG